MSMLEFVRRLERLSGVVVIRKKWYIEHNGVLATGNTLFSSKRLFVVEFGISLCFEAYVIFKSSSTHIVRPIHPKIILP